MEVELFLDAALVLAWVGEWWLVGATLLTLVGWALWQGRRCAALAAAAAYVFALVLVLALKHVTALPRPPDALLTVSGYRFPSGHATLATAGYVMGALLIPKLSLRSLAVVVAVALAALVGVSRVVLQVHEMSDVVGGWLIGAGVAGGWWVLVRKWCRPPAPLASYE